MTKHKKLSQGFTLVELLIVVAIIGLLATLAVISLTSAQQRSRDTKRVADVKSIQSLMELYYNDTAKYPDVTAGTTTWTTVSAAMSSYTNALPIDPTNTVGSTKVYTYHANAPTNVTKYIISAELEANSNAKTALGQDLDGTQAASYYAVKSDNSVAAQNAATGYACGTNDSSEVRYCVGN